MVHVQITCSFPGQAGRFETNLNMQMGTHRAPEMLPVMVKLILRAVEVRKFHDDFPFKRARYRHPALVNVEAQSLCLAANATRANLKNVFFARAAFAFALRHRPAALFTIKSHIQGAVIVRSFPVTPGVIR